MSKAQVLDRHVIAPPSRTLRVGALQGKGGVATQHLNRAVPGDEGSGRQHLVCGGQALLVTLPARQAGRAQRERGNTRVRLERGFIKALESSSQPARFPVSVPCRAPHSTVQPKQVKACGASALAARHRAAQGSPQHPPT